MKRRRGVFPLDRSTPRQLTDAERLDFLEWSGSQVTYCAMADGRADPFRWAVHDTSGDHVLGSGHTVRAAIDDADHHFIARAPSSSSSSSSSSAGRQ